jgi:hypothetical protein
MANKTPIDKLVESRPDLEEKIDHDGLSRVLTEPQQERLYEAAAADAVDAAPIVGDILALHRRELAAENGNEYPQRPAFVENVISDLPPPLDTVGDIIVSQNTLKYLEERGGE